MGFMDKAKKMAEQAQTKIDEAQKQFNDMQSGGTAPPASQGPVVQYDQHGRPIGDPPVAPGTGEPPAPAGPTVGAPMPQAPPPPPAPPTADAPPPPPPPAPAPAPAPPPAPPAAPPTGADRSGDAPPPMTSGDPLAG